MNNSGHTTEHQGAARGVLARLGLICAGLFASFLLLDILLGFVLTRGFAVRQTVDIQKSETLYAKLDELRRFQGVKIAVLGDSLIFGRTMRDHGDKDWQDHTLSSQLQRYLTRRGDGRPVMVANLGMNGTLPVDLDQLVRIVLPLKPDLIIFDLSLRSFSRDFGAEADTQTRKWLSDLNVSPDGHYSATANYRSVSRVLHDFAVNHWQLYRLRDLFQSVVFDGEPVAYLVSWRNRIDAWFGQARNANASQTADDLDEIVLMMRARARYANIDLDADNPQRMALDRILQRLKSANQPALIFYATESPKVLPQLMPLAKFNALQSQLSETIQPNAATSQNITFLGPQSIYAAENFLDHVHLDQEGYRRLAEELWPRVDRMLERAN